MQLTPRTPDEELKRSLLGIRLKIATHSNNLGIVACCVSLVAWTTVALYLFLTNPEPSPQILGGLLGLIGGNIGMLVLGFFLLRRRHQYRQLKADNKFTNEEWKSW